jgi:serine phosphatase RsbU (regulator of sigma subunit)
MLKSFLSVFTIRWKIIIALIISFIILVTGYFTYQYISVKNNRNINLSQKEILDVSLKAILKTKTEVPELLLIDYGCYDWMISYVNHPDLKEAKTNITPVQAFKLSFIQIYNLKGENVYADFSEPFKKVIYFPAGVFPLLYKNRNLIFYLNTEEGLVQVVGSTIHPSHDLQKKTAPKGYIFIGNLWDKAFVNELEKLIGGDVAFNNKPDIVPSEASDTISIPFHSFDSKIVSSLLAHRDNPYANRIENLNKFFKIFFVSICVLILFIVLLAFNILILRPLRLISNSLKYDIPDILVKLALRGDEFGKIARLIIQFFSQRDMLQNQLRELNQTKDEMDTLNQLLQSQKEEIQTSIDELLLANDEISSKNSEISWQKEEIEIKNRELTESIRYAAIVQKAVQLTPKGFKNNFPDYFVINMPRDILSGDFLWIRENQGRYYLAVADCTGHSLAGALLSMLGISFLNEIIGRQTNFKASEILNELREFIKETLHQTGVFGEAHSGMDIVFCIVEPESKQLQFAGAFNSLYLVTNSSNNQNELIEYKGDSMPVGVYIKNDSFTNHVINFKSGEAIYMFSDGFVDQFGGPMNKKFLSKNFKKLILSASQLPVCEQKAFIADEIKKWQGDNPQTDDILLLGIKLNGTIKE